MDRRVTLIGFGEAASAFADGAGWDARAFDVKTLHPATRDAKLSDYAEHDVQGCERASGALADAAVILSLVTADRAAEAARAASALLSPGALWIDMNSVSPETKRAAARTIERSGARYVDVAVMAPVHPKRRDVPLLVSGPHADAARATLAALGFTSIETVGGATGDAAAVKMIRSVLVKGIEALTAEAMLAAHAAGVTDAVLASLSEREDWTARADYNLDRMLVHGLRRAAEMEEVAMTLKDLGVDPAMTRGTIARQRQLGALGMAAPEGLAAKLARIEDRLMPRRSGEEAA